MLAQKFKKKLADCFSFVTISFKRNVSVQNIEYTLSLLCCDLVSYIPALIVPWIPEHLDVSIPSCSACLVTFLVSTKTWFMSTNA